jgi:hypothetical protein
LFTWNWTVAVPDGDFVAVPWPDFDEYVACPEGLEVAAFVTVLATAFAL